MKILTSNKRHDGVKSYGAYKKKKSYKHVQISNLYCKKINLEKTDLNIKLDPFLSATVKHSRIMFSNR